MNHWFKEFGALKQVFRHNIGVHCMVVELIVVLTQLLGIKNGDKFFQIDDYY